MFSLYARMQELHRKSM